MEQFKLPRNDWYDSDGRMYKDALIENFNAIEKAFQDLTELGAINIQDINWDNVHLTDVTLNDANNKIVNVSSLVDLMNLDGIAFNEAFEGKKCINIEYYKNKNKKHLTNINLSNLAEGDFIWLSIDNDRLDIVKPGSIATKIAGEPTGIIVGQFISGVVQTRYTGQKIQYNVLDVLSKMKTTPISITTGGRSKNQPVVRDRFSGRRLGITIQNTRGGSFLSNPSIMPDIGYEGDGTR